jgi:hypothetical protein
MVIAQIETISEGSSSGEEEHVLSKLVKETAGHNFVTCRTPMNQN